MPSIPIWTSVIASTPFLAHLAYSVDFIRREALAMSENPSPTPLQNCAMPAPVPIDSTVGAGRSG